MTTQTTSDLSIVRTEHPNVARMREAFAAFDRGDLDAVLADMTEDCTWHNAGSGPIAGPHQGRAAITEMFVQLFTLTGGTFKTTPVSVLADDVHAVAVYDSTATIAGETKTMRWVLTDELDTEGRITAAHVFAYDQAAADDFMATALVLPQG
jgi:uncharacterized protein (TIGR02246 family)